MLDTIMSFTLEIFGALCFLFVGLGLGVEGMLRFHPEEIGKYPYKKRSWKGWIIEVVVLVLGFIFFHFANKF